MLIENDKYLEKFNPAIVGNLDRNLSSFFKVLEFRKTISRPRKIAIIGETRFDKYTEGRVRIDNHNVSLREETRISRLGQTALMSEFFSFFSFL